MKLNGIVIDPYLNLMPDSSVSAFLNKTFRIRKGVHNEVTIDMSHEDHLEILLGVKSAVRQIVHAPIDWVIRLPYVPGSFRGHDAVISYLKAVCDTEADEKLTLHTIDCVASTDMQHVNITHANVTFKQVALSEWAAGQLTGNFNMHNKCKLTTDLVKLVSGDLWVNQHNLPTIITYYGFDVKNLLELMENCVPGVVINPHMTDSMRTAIMLKGWKVVTTDTFNQGLDSVRCEELW